MKSTLGILGTALSLLVSLAAALPEGERSEGTSHAKRQISSIVKGTPPGFAYAATGGGTATPVYPTTVAQLEAYLTSDEPQNIVISGTFNFAGTEGTTTYQACDPYSCAHTSGGQGLLNTLNGCGSQSLYSASIDVAAYVGIYVKSDKTLVGVNGATLNGKGLRFVNGVSNIIIQNIKITNLNPQYVWGGDAITLSGVDTIWIDHVTTSSLGRQHYSFGPDQSKYITISNSFIDGRTSYSATCDGHTYWGLELVGEGDEIFFYKNYVYYTSGRSPALSGSTLLHAVNNVWSTNAGHLLEGGPNSFGLYEGNYFLNVPTVQSGFTGTLFASGSSVASQCQQYIGRSCVPNSYSGSGSLDSFTSSSWLTRLSNRGYLVVPESASSIASSVPASAGNTL